jgi:predicted nucleotidyltransferase
MRLRDTVLALSRDIRRAAESHGVGRVRLFGSVARGEEGADSDIDLVVSLSPGGTLMDLARLEVALERLLGRPVDVVPESGLREPFRSAVLRDAVDV